MAGKEKVDIKRSDQFQEMDEELTRAMEELDSTIDRVSQLFQSEADLPAGADAPESPQGTAGPASSAGTGSQEQTLESTAPDAAGAAE